MSVAYGLRQSGVGLFGSYKPVASHTYEVTIDNEQPMNNQHPFFITIKNNKLYFSDDEHTTIESMNNRNDNAYSCELE